MLIDLIQALTAHLAPTHTAIYQADCVPDNTVLPYITFAMTAPGSLTLTAWHTTNAGRIALAEQLIALLPPRGTCLQLSSGTAVLTGGTLTFLHDGPLLGARRVWKLALHPAASGGDA